MYQIQKARRITMDDGALARKGKKVTLEYNEAQKLEESMLKQKARAQWIEPGDGDKQNFPYIYPGQKKQESYKKN